MLAAAAVALAACGGGGPAPTTTGSTTGSGNFGKALAFSKCMRSHGVPDFPDPNSKGVFIEQNGAPSLSESQSVVRAAFQACQHLMPAGGPGSLTQGQKQQMQQQALKFVKCMRAHGLPGMPDPGADGSISLPQGMKGNSPQVKAAQRACQALQPGPPGGGQ
jgi:hypothetical protein